MRKKKLSLGEIKVESFTTSKNLSGGNNTLFCTYTEPTQCIIISTNLMNQCIVDGCGH